MSADDRSHGHGGRRVLVLAESHDAISAGSGEPVSEDRVDASLGDRLVA